MKALILGAGETGRRLAPRMLESGADVTLASRSGTEVPGVRAVALDAADASAVGEAAKDVDTVFLVTNPPQYHRWAELWPPVVDAVVSASRGRDLVVMSNLYVYGRARMPMTEHSPLQPAESKGAVRLDLWRRVLAAHDRGDLRAVEVRASDYFGAGVGMTAMLGERFFAPLLAGRTARVVGAPTSRTAGPTSTTSRRPWRPRRTIEATGDERGTCRATSPARAAPSLASCRIPTT